MLLCVLQNYANSTFCSLLMRVMVSNVVCFSGFDLQAELGRTLLT